MTVLADVKPLAVRGPDGDRTARLEPVLGTLSPSLARLCEEMASASPFLSRVLEREGEWLGGIVELDPANTLASIRTGLLDSANDEANVQDTRLMDALREARERVALLVALVDCGGLWPLEAVTDALSDFADTCCRVAWDRAVRSAGRRGTTFEPDRGGFVLALGKHGARELNYSSDIDLVCFFDRDHVEPGMAGEASDGFVRAAKGFTTLLASRHEGRIAHRVDWRLRPDPGATPLAISTAAAINYYQSQGRSWERMAFIKARVVAGDREAARGFLAELEPFVWRRSLDFALAEEMGRMADRVRRSRGEDVALGADPAGWNIKTGRGGIREVEFLVQSQQTILGGRDPDLRQASTLQTIEDLKERGVLRLEAARDLEKGYRHFRTLEHRLQMIDDAQTQAFPPEGAQRERLAALMGVNGADLLGDVDRNRRSVAGAFDAVMPTQEEPEDEDSEAARVLVLLDAPGGEANESLTAMGFADVDAASARLRGWIAKRYPALRSSGAREAADRALPLLLDAVAKADDPDRALLDVDRLLSRLPAGLQLFAMLRAKPSLTALLVRLLSEAPAVGEGLSRDPAMLVGFAEPDFWARPEREEIAERIEGLARRAGGLEATMDAVRLVNRAEMFRLALRVLEGDDPYAIAHDMTLATEAGLAALWKASLLERGVSENEPIAVVALGRMGAREMSHASDLDLMVVARSGEDAQRDARLVRTFIAAITSPTAEGRFRAVDMRLRPSGNAGPLVTTLRGFELHHEKAEAWELIALGRARPLLGPEPFRARVGEAITSALTSVDDRRAFASGARSVLERVRRDRPPLGILDVKGRRGGLFEIEFAVQAARIARGMELGETATPVLLRALEEAGAPGVGALIEAHERLTRMLLHLGITVGGVPTGVPSERIATATLEVAGLGMNVFDDLLDRSARASEELMEWSFDGPMT